MITLRKGSVFMSVNTEQQAFVFERAGYERVRPGPAKEPEPVVEEIAETPEPAPEEKPKRRVRKSAKKAE